MSDEMLLLAQSFVDVIAWFLVPFAFMLVISWVISFFRR